LEACQIVLCPCPNLTEARLIASALVEQDLATAVNIIAQHSVYRWHGQINSGDEFLLMIKRQRARYESIERMILDMHSYELPGIAAVPIVDGFAPYLDWLRSGGQP